MFDIRGTSMNYYNNMLSSKPLFVISATILAAMMLAASSTTSLVPTRAFAQENPADDVLRQLNVDSSSETVINNNEEDNITVDPIIQADPQTDLNVNADVAVVTDESECEEANHDVSQINAQDSDLEGQSNGAVSDNGFYVSPKVQYTGLFAFNVNADYDVVLSAACGEPNDKLEQGNIQSADQKTGGDTEVGEGSTVIIPADQRMDSIAQNIALGEDIMLPVLE